MYSGDADRHVLVGYDGSDEGERVLRWAAEEARLRYLPLVVCHAYRWPFPIPPTDKDVLHTMARTAKAVVDRGVLIVGRLDPRVEVRPRLSMGSASAVLLSQSAEADLIVVGSRGSGGFESLRVGSVAAQVAAHSLRPTVVVRRAATVLPGEPKRIVVGIDGSPASEAALAFAFEEAAIRRGSLEVVCSWWDPGAAPVPPTVPFIDLEALKREAAARFHRTIAPWLEKYRQVDTKTSFVVEPPHEALSRAAAGATLLVVGDRGLGSPPELLLGPVAQAMLQRAPCSVAITPAPPVA